MRNENKSPLSGYYGGKHRLARKIISLIPKHSTYIEPFFGGGSVFFLKKISNKEIINDKDNQLYRFWKVCKENTYDLYKKLKNITSFKKEHERSVKVLKGEEDAENEIDFASCFMINISHSFNGVKNDSFFLRNNNIRDSIRQWRGKVSLINNMILRLKDVDIYNKDAAWCIKKFDSDKSFFYLDPPYPGTNQKHYSGYSIDNFNNLCSVLSNMKGKFILSCYLKKEMKISPYWKIEEITSCRGLHNSKRRKIIRKEALIRNY